MYKSYDIFWNKVYINYARNGAFVFKMMEMSRNDKKELDREEKMVIYFLSALVIF